MIVKEQENTETTVKTDIASDEHTNVSEVVNEITNKETSQVTPPEEQTIKEPIVESKKEVVVHSGDEAMEYLKAQIPEGSNEDIIFGAAQELEIDEKGSYYFVRLSSLSLRLQGGTGTIDTYKVYQDGHFETMN